MVLPMPAGERRIVHNRIAAFLAHTHRFAFDPVSRLAADCGASKSAVSRLLSGQTSPSFTLVWAITRVLERELNTSLDPRELVSLDGRYPTASVCALVGCPGCALSVSVDSGRSADV